MAEAATIHVDMRDVDYAMSVFPTTFHKHLKREFFGILKKHRLATARDFGRQSKRQRRAQFWAMDQISQYRKGDKLAHLEGGVFTRSAALEAHERGETITARNPSGDMWIPIADSLTATGMVKKRFRKINGTFASGRDKVGRFSLSEIPNVEIIKLRGRRLAVSKVETLGNAETDTGEIRKIYAVAVKQVKLQRRLHFYRTWDQQENIRALALRRATNRTLSDIRRAKGVSRAARR